MKKYEMNSFFLKAGTHQADSQRSGLLEKAEKVRRPSLYGVFAHITILFFFSVLGLLVKDIILIGCAVKRMSA